MISALHCTIGVWLLVTFEHQGAVWAGRGVTHARGNTGDSCDISGNPANLFHRELGVLQRTVSLRKYGRVAPSSFSFALTLSLI